MKIQGGGFEGGAGGQEIKAVVAVPEPQQEAGKIYAPLQPQLSDLLNPLKSRPRIHSNLPRFERRTADLDPPSASVAPRTLQSRPTTSRDLC